MNRLIYMDHAGTTKLDARVLEAMTPFLRDAFGNASQLYALGAQAKQAVEQAREHVAALIGAKTSEVYFTSGGTESDNWALAGVVHANEQRGDHIVTTQIEHEAVLKTAKFLEKHGFRVTYVPVDAEGMVDPGDVRKAITDKTILISVMHANNEVGTIQPVEEIGRIAKERGVYFHVDAVQTVGSVPVDVNRLGCDLLSLSAHKFHGPKGIGAMYMRRRTKIGTFMNGGGQEGGRRAGTHNVPGIVGLGEAARLAMLEMDGARPRITALRDRLTAGTLDRLDGVKYNGHPTQRLPNNVNVCLRWAEGEAILLMLDAHGICASSGSACTSGSLDPSHVLLAMGIPAELAHGSLRFTLGKENTEEEVDYVLDVLPKSVQRIRDMSPTYREAKKAKAVAPAHVLR
jgi:cysteine desulfurase